MENLNLILFISIITPLAMMIPVYRGESRVILGFLMSGIFMCLFAGEVNGLIFNMSGMTQYDMTIDVTPVVEEILKAVPVLAMAFLYRPGSNLILQCSLAAGVGFAILENAFILSGAASVSIGLALVRGFGSGMMHGICTMAVGYAVSYINTRRKLFYTGTFAALTVAILYHSIYNCIVQSQYEVFGILLPLITYIPIVILLVKRKNKEENRL